MTFIWQKYAILTMELGNLLFKGEAYLGGRDDFRCFYLIEVLWHVRFD